jgi:Predicted membrane protein (DUF2306)
MLQRLAWTLAGVLILKVTLGMVGNYGSYFSPDFRVDFLRGRESYFFGGYRWAFYAHLISGPVALLLGMALVGDSLRRRSPAWHRASGRIQVLVVAFMVAPSGLVMAFHSAAGPAGGVALGVLAILTAATALIGARMAMLRRFAEHRRWMWRCFLLLGSSVVLRVGVGLATVLGATPWWIDPVATWSSWIVPLAAFEWLGRGARTPRRAGVASARPGD